MRADNDWEDSLGKKLHDFEGELTPGSWQKIQKEIKPRRHRWAIVLPLLLLLTIPGGLYYFNNQGITVSRHSESGQAETDEKRIAGSTVKPGLPAKNETLKPGTLREPEIAASENLNAGNQPDAINADSQPITQKPDKQPGKTKPNVAGNPALIALIPEKEQPVYKPEEEKKSTPKPALYAGVISASAKKGALAKNENHAETGKTAESKQVAAGKINNVTNLPIAAAITSAGNNPEHPVNNIAGNNNPETTPEIATGTKHNETIITAKKGEVQILDLINSQLHPAAGNTHIPALLPVAEDSVLNASKLTAENRNDSTGKKDDKPAQNWALSVYGMPQYTYLRVAPNTSDNTQIRKLDNKNKFSEERIGYEAGMLVSYPVTKKTELEFGFHFTYLNQYLLLSASSPLADSMVVRVANGAITAQAYNREEKIEHRLQYYFGGLYTGVKTALLPGLNATGGVGANWLLHSRITPEGANIPSVNLNPYLSAGLQVNIPVSTRLNFQVGPTMQYYLRSVQAEEAAFGAKPTVFGISAGLQLKK